MDRFIFGNAGTGKTRELLEIAKQYNAIVVCKNPDAMRVKAQNYGLYRMDFRGYDELKDIEDGAPVVIDELSDFFSNIYGVDMVGFDMTEDVT